MSGSGVITQQLGLVSQKLGKDTDTIYEDMFGGFSMPRDKLTKGVSGAELKKGGLVRGYGVAIKGKKKIRVL
jgi:hypothetical protein